MKYEIIHLEASDFCGLKIRTNNGNPDMGVKIKKAWEDFFVQGIYATIPNKANEKCLGIYTNYESDATGDYDLVVASATSKPTSIEVPNTDYELISGKIPEGKYAKFVIQGNIQQEIYNCWNEIWHSDLDRSFTCDFEEYQNPGQQENAEVHLYIGLK